MVKVIRTLRVNPSSAVKARAQTFNTLFDIIIGAPSPLRDELVALTKRTSIDRCLGLRPETTDFAELRKHPERLLIASIKTSLRDLARRWKTFDGETKTLSKQIETVVSTAAPDLVELFGVGVELAG